MDLTKQIIEACKFVCKQYKMIITEKVYLDGYHICPLSACAVYQSETAQKEVAEYLSNVDKAYQEQEDDYADVWPLWDSDKYLEDSDSDILKQIHLASFIDGFDGNGFSCDSDHPRNFADYLLGRNLRDELYDNYVEYTKIGLNIN